jgi:hypothetical protein
MSRSRLRPAVRRARLSPFERHALLIGAILTAVAFPVAWIHQETGGLARVIASYGLAVVALSAASRGLRLYLLGMTASLPTSVARIPVRVRPPRLSSANAVVLGYSCRSQRSCPFWCLSGGHGWCSLACSSSAGSA